jgi:hypothetical protein
VAFKKCKKYFFWNQSDITFPPSIVPITKLAMEVTKKLGLPKT